MTTRHNTEIPQPMTGEHGDWAGTNLNEKRALGDLQKLHRLKTEFESQMGHPDAMSGLRASTIRDLEELQDLIREYADFERTATDQQRESLKARIGEIEARVNKSVDIVNRANDKAPKN